jgi:hypothetical protein
MAVGDKIATTGEGSTNAKNNIVVALAAKKDAHATVTSRRGPDESSLSLSSGFNLRDTKRSHAQDIGGEQFDA